MKVGLKFFNLIKQTKKPCAKFINKDTNKQVKSLTKYTCKDTNQTLYRSQIGTHFPVKNKKVILTENDMKKIKHFDDSGMKLIGFRAKSSIKTYHNIRPSYFIYPDERIIRGSSQTFHAMIKSLIKKDKVAIVRFVPREGAMVRFCAMVPQDENPNNDALGGQYTPPGFNLVFLPYAEDVRDIEEHLSHNEKLPEPSKEEARTAKLFVKNMSIDFNPRNFENPSIQKFYSGLQSFALNEDQPEEFQDTLEPDREGMKKMHQVIDKVKETFGLGSLPKVTPKVKAAGKRS
jgi:ATP-dependent DNA helicase 2 subunit 1